MPRKDKKKAAKAKPETTEPAVSVAPKEWTCAECAYEHADEEADSPVCLACDEPRPDAGNAGGEGEDAGSLVKCGVVLELEELSGKLKCLKVDVGLGEDHELTVVTNAPNVAEGSRVVVATVGAKVPAKDGEELTIKKQSVGGRISEGMLCDSPMLGWVGGGSGTAALVPDSFAPGDSPPDRRPRMDGK